MLKLIIADDEPIIRDTISQLIDWNSLGIELIGCCSDGIEAYNMILDESPDIVLSDIEMPGLSGLNLIQRFAQIDSGIHFILLSGYSEFEYAKEAMKYGVRHYLLKPCNEDHIIESMRDVIKEYYHKRAFQELQENQRTITRNLHHTILSNIINEGVSLPEENFLLLSDPYSRFIDFYNVEYELCYLHFLEEANLAATLQSIYNYMKKNAPGIQVYGVYVKNTLLVFFESHQISYTQLDMEFRTLVPLGCSSFIEYRRQSFVNLSELLEKLLHSIRRYGIIYFMNGLRPVPTCNYSNLITEVEKLILKLTKSSNEKWKEQIKMLKSILEDISDSDFLKQLADSIIIKFTINTNSYLPIETTNFLMQLNQETDLECIRTMLYKKIQQILCSLSTESQIYSSFIEKIMQYVEENLSNQNLTLKWICGNYLYMNVDYVSRRFYKETGQKFSNYISTMRISKAQQLLVENPSANIQWIAEQVGCGHNPHYFIQIFKKYTGMTPSAYTKRNDGTSKHEKHKIDQFIYEKKENKI